MWKFKKPLTLKVLEGQLMDKRCTHDKIEFLGEQKGEKEVNRYYRCMKCRSVLIKCDERVLYEVPSNNVKT